MAFTCSDAAELWKKLKENRPATTSRADLDNEMANLEEIKSFDELEKKLRELFDRAGIEYPEKIHPLNIKKIFITAISQLEEKY